MEYTISEKSLFGWVLQGKITKAEADVIRSQLLSVVIQAEREKVLDEYASWMKKHHYPTTGGHRIIGYEKLKEGLQSLRTKPVEPK
jgi:hypothetical protein